MQSKVRKVAMVTGFEEQILRSIPAEDTFELQVYSNSAAVGLEVDSENLSDFLQISRMIMLKSRCNLHDRSCLRSLRLGFYGVAPFHGFPAVV